MTQLKLLTEGGDELFLAPCAVKAVVSCPVGSHIHIGDGFQFTVKLSPDQVVKYLDHVDRSQSNRTFIDSDEIVGTQKDRIGF